MEQHERGELAASSGAPSTYPFPASGEGPSGPSAATSIHVMESPSSRAGDPQGRTDDVREGVADRASGEADAAARAESEARVERARFTRRRRDGEQVPAMAAPFGLALALGAGFVAGALWAIGRR